MSVFLTELRAAKPIFDQSSDGRGTWRLLEPLEYSSDLLGGIVSVPAGFLTDFASVPRIPVAFLFMGNQVHEAAVVHDWLYSTHAFEGKPITRETADQVFREACIACGSYGWKAWLFYKGVEIGGAGPWEAANTPQTAAVDKAMRAERDAG